MPRKPPIQYTIRSVPPSLDRALRAKAQQEDKSINQVAIEALRRGLGLEKDEVLRDLSSLAGTWQDDPEFDGILESQDQVLVLGSFQPEAPHA